MTGTVVGYDPGGNCKHGLAWATVRHGRIVSVTTETLANVEEVLASIPKIQPLGLGIDTHTCWSTGPSGWRPADRWLRCRYPDVRNSILAPGSLHGAMSVNGMALLVAVRQAFPGIFVTETHPKVLYHALFKQTYDFDVNRSDMTKYLNDRLNLDVAPQDEVDVAPRNEHEWDAAISIHAVVSALKGRWQRDLHARPTNPYERLVQPCGRTEYVWPESNSGLVIRPTTPTREACKAD